MKKLLLVDDEAMFADALSTRLQSVMEDVEVTAVSSCEKAFALLGTGAEFDLILMDLTLGPSGLSGADGIRKLRSDYPDIPVVALSGTRDSAIMRKTIDDGAMGFIPKTRSEAMLLWALQLILVHNGIYVPPEILSDFSEKLVIAESIGLTPRQADVLYQLLKGLSNKAIAQELGITETVVRNYMGTVLRVLKVTNRTEAVIVAGRMNLVFRHKSSHRLIYTCPGCSAQVWGPGGLVLMCNPCGHPMPGQSSLGNATGR
jgi:DNA-binding NarL/FixJ family response regulator